MIKIRSKSHLKNSIKNIDPIKSNRAEQHNNIGNIKQVAILCLLIYFTFPRVCHAQFAGGDGTDANPYQITNWKELNEVRNYVGPSNKSKKFQLMNDLDPTTEGYGLYIMSNDTLSNGGKGWKPIGLGKDYTLSGIFNGGGHCIYDICIDQKDATHSGLFGSLDVTGVVTNLSIKRGVITSGYYVGGIVGYNYGGTISNSSFSGEIDGNSNVGGLVGYNNGGVITCCYSIVGVVANGQWTGGLVGFNSDSGKISNCYSISGVSGGASIGGLVGYNKGSITNCYSAGSASGNIYRGDLIGYHAGGLYSSCFCIGTSATSVGSKVDATIGIAGKTSDEMKARITFKEWDFASVWDIKTGDSISYPFLRSVTQFPIPGKVVNKTPIVIKGNIGKNTQTLTVTLSRNLLTFSNSFPPGTPFSLFDFSGREVIAGFLESTTYNVKTLSNEMHVLRIIAKNAIHYVKVMPR